jgi:hypothetical protein
VRGQHIAPANDPPSNERHEVRALAFKDAAEKSERLLHGGRLKKRQIAALACDGIKHDTELCEVLFTQACDLCSHEV